MLKPLKPGRYRVTWHAVSVDTHRTEGKYNFLVVP
jgi:methionine-rich copper-binding protein CopC